jgi:hypothetical protein
VCHLVRINPDLTVGTDVTKALPLKANEGLALKGVKLHGDGFIVTREKAAALGLGTVPGLERHIRTYRNGRDLMQTNRDVMVIDLFGLTEAEVQARYSAVYEHVRTYVKPERDMNNRKSRKNNWWVFGETAREMRTCLKGLGRFVGVPQTTKHFVFQFLSDDVLPDNSLVGFSFDEAWQLAILSSHTHSTWALATGTILGPTPRYNHTTCFNTFPFPDPPPQQKARLAAAGEALDGHRKARQAAHPGLTITLLYNVLAKVRAGTLLTAAESGASEQGDVARLAELHAEVDAATLDAYGWNPGLTDTDLVAKLAALNAARAAEERAGHVRWVRGGYQCPKIKCNYAH